MEDKKEKLESLLIALDNLEETMTRTIDKLRTRVENILKEANEEQKSTVRIVPFDIEKAKQGAKIVTRDGDNVRILCYDSKYYDGQRPIVAEIDKNCEIRLATYAKDGTQSYYKSKSNLDLMIKED